MIYLYLVIIFVLGSALKNGFVLRSHSFSDENNIIRIRKETRWVFFFMIICALVMGVRAETVGEDTQRYMSYFYYVTSMPFGAVRIGAMNTGLDIGYVVLMKTISLIYDNYYFFQLIISLFICVGFAYFIIKNQIDTAIGITVFLGNGLFFAAFNTARQSCALTILLIAWSFLQEKKYLKVLLLIGVASSIHMSAVLFLIPTIMFIFRKKKFIYWLVLGSTILIGVLYRQVLFFLASILPQYSHITSNTNQYMNIGLSSIVWIIVGVFSLFILKKSKLYNEKERIYAACALFYPFFSCLGLVVNSFERLGFYFMPFVPFVVDLFGKKVFRNNRIMFRIIVSTCYLVWFLFASINYPYQLA